MAGNSYYFQFNPHSFNFIHGSHIAKQPSSRKPNSIELSNNNETRDITCLIKELLSLLGQ